MKRSFRAGQKVVYIASKRSDHPGPRAQNVRPDASGEGYSYQVDKFWIIEEVKERVVVIRTRRNKRREITTDDPCLRPATWWERWILRKRFPSY